METKICNKCELEKSTDLFWKDSKTKDGYTRWCVACMKESKKKWYYSEAHSDILKTQKEYKKKNKDKMIEDRKKYYEENKERELLMNKEYAKNNPQVISEKRNRRRSKLSPPKNFNKIQTQWFYILRDIEIELTGIPHHVDHIISIKMGGKHEHTNLRVIPAWENLYKSSKV